jgi:asparagine synthase (glutamine-hydrolysing)
MNGRRLQPILDRLRHRGPDDEGYLVVNTTTREIEALTGPESAPAPSLRSITAATAPDGDLVLGHRRLSILDLSPAGHQPMMAPGGRFWITYNGEIYNYLELREELKRDHGIEFHTGSDTEVILAAWAAWGEDCLARFNGDWALAVLDLTPPEGEGPRLTLARDRYGVKPLFYHATAERFWFASEAKGLIGTVVPFAPEPQAVLRFIASATHPAAQSGETYFVGLQQLPPGGIIQVRAGSVAVGHWYDWEARTASAPLASETQAVSELAAHVTSAVALRLRADVPVGSCLSGGVDSSAIVGTMRHLLRESSATPESASPVHAFSAVYHTDGTYNERVWIDQVAHATGAQQHLVFPDDEPLTEMFEKVVWHQDEPFQTASIFAQWCVMKKAKAAGVTVLLDGQAADELFGGYQPGTVQERHLELIHQRKWGHFIREWRARRSASPESLNLQSLWDMLRWGAFGRRREPHLRSTRDTHADLALSPDAERELGLSEEHLRAKRAEIQTKITELAAKKKLSAEERQTRSDKYRNSLRTTEMRLAQLTQPPRLRDQLWRVWRRLSGQHVHSLRAQLTQQWRETSLPILLRFEDRNSMAFSIEARVPFTDFRVAEWAFTAADPYKVHRGWTKWVLRTAMEGRVPPEILWRKDKVGFEAPDLPLCQELLQSRAPYWLQSPVFDPWLDRAAAAVQIHSVATGTADGPTAQRVWRWLVLESWHRQYTATTPFTA